MGDLHHHPLKMRIIRW